VRRVQGVEGVAMAVEKWSESVVIVHLASDPQFSEDLESLERVVASGGVAAVLDFSGVHYLTSSNISHLLRLRKIMVNVESRFVLCCIDTRLWSTFLITGLDKVFTFTDSVTTGLATLQMA
jgi:anti-anti-sigma factor